MDDLSVTEQLEAPPRSSVEKLEAGLAQLASAQADDQGSAFALSSLRAILPTLRMLGFVPDDPVELDHLLLIGARWALGLRSDDAWHPASLDELFLGPGPEPEPGPGEAVSDGAA
jgi:hypothetical protein